MRKSELINNIKEYIKNTAGQKNPAITANAMYFIFKQYALSIESRKSYIPVLKEVKKYLVSEFQWSMCEVHDCFCKLNNLLKY
jgi:hypothetical protein